MKKILFLISFSIFLLGDAYSQDCSIITIFNSTNVSLDINGEADVDPEMIVANMIGNCNYEIALASDLGNGTYTLLIPYGSSITVTCEYVGTYIVVVRDVDSGNTAWGTLNIEDVLGACPLYFGADTYSLIYNARNFQGQINTDVTLNGNPVNQVYDWVDTITQADLVTGENVLDFPASTNANPSGSLTTLDLVDIVKIFNFGTEYPLKAVLGDVDGSGYLNVNDAVALRNWILGISGAALADNYLFVSKTYEFPVDFDPFDFTDLNFREYRFDKDLVTQEDLEFFVYQYGNISDVTDSLITENATNRSSLELNLENKEVSVGQVIEVPMSLVSENFDLQGIQIEMNLEGLNLLNVDHGYAGDKLLYNQLSDKESRFSYLDLDGSSEFEMILEIEVLQNGSLKDMISLNQNFSQMAVGDDQHSTIDLNFQSSSSTEELAEIKTRLLGSELQISLPDNHTNELFLLDIQGKQVKRIAPLSNVINVDLSSLQDGMYILSTMIEGKMSSTKIILFNR